MSISFIAKIEELILRFTKPDYMDSKDTLSEFLKNKPLQKPPKGIFKSRDIGGCEVFTFGDENDKNTILFIHGGAYINELNYQHLLYCWMISRKLDAYVIVPVYPLAPSSNAMDAYGVLVPFYEKLIQNHDLIMMGDSAGGGFIYSFCQHIKTVNLPQPEKIITFSPWVDISMSNFYDSTNDPILGEEGLREIGKSWAGDLDTKDYRVSPLFGDNSDLPDTLIFAGTNEIFYRDIEKYADNLKRDGVNVRFVTGHGLFHIYPMFPSPEARKAFKKIKEEIMR